MSLGYPDEIIAKIPPLVKLGIDRFHLTGTPVGGFLTAVLCGDPWYFVVHHADDDSLGAIREILWYLGEKAPGGYWGTPEKHEAWMERGGVQGKSE